MIVVGVDGCSGGWLAIAYDTERQELYPRTFLGLTPFQQLLTAYADAKCITIDIPIGLSRGAARLPDTEARRVLGPRRSSVFPAPDPRVIDAPTYAEATTRSRSLLDKGISQQAFAIYGKIAEINTIMTPTLQERVIEVHPEVCFWALANGTPMNHPKRTSAGFDERHALLTAAFPNVAIPNRREASRYAPPAKADDVLDAIAAVWTATRVAKGSARRLPAAPLLDERGIRMEIVY